MPYAEPPWVFKGRALYQLQLVKESEARKYTPAELPLVSLFGYTLGGFYLARYSDSPVGAFDELVVISGLVWNWPTSCAWAARVYVNDSSARAHGRKDVGLPSRLATFKTGTSLPHRKKLSWWHKPDSGRKHPKGPEQQRQQQQQAGEAVSSIVIRNAERRHWAQPWKRNQEQMQQPVCTLHLPDALKGWNGPRLKLSLPSFSGNTTDQPGLLQYSCRLVTNIRPSKPAHIEGTADDDSTDMESMSHILRGKPVLALCFDDMEMKVNAPLPYKVKMPSQQEQRQLVPV